MDHFDNSSKLWYSEGAGQRLLDEEKEKLAQILQKLCGYHLVILGDPAFSALTYSSRITHRILVNPTLSTPVKPISFLKADLDALPLQSDSVDVVILSHTLEQVDNPHEVLRETQRILIPEGHVIITGINPISLWGAWHSYHRLRGKFIRQGTMMSMNRVKDWLKLLNFQITGGSMFYFRPPVSQYGLYQKLGFLERWGQKCWPFCGGAYTLSAVKRVIPITPVRAKWLREKPIWQPIEGVAKPSTTARK